MFGKTLFVYNPISGPDKKRVPVEIIEANLKIAEVDYDLLVTTHRGHAAEFLNANHPDYKTIVCSGGDGTVNEILNSRGLNHTHQILLISQGTGNDLQRSLNGRRNPRIFDFKAYRRLQKLDIGVIEGKYEDGALFRKKFCNAIGVGLDSLIAKYVSELKKRNNFSYILSLLKAILHYKPIGCTVKNGKTVLANKMILLSINNGKTSGGGFYLAPDALLDDRKLDLCFINNLSKLRIIKHFPKVLNNRIKEFKEVILAQGEEFKVELATPYYLHIDGEMEEKPVKEFRVFLEEETKSFFLQ